MKKIGRHRIDKNTTARGHAQCMSCGKEAGFRVIFKDKWSKIVVKLCEKCAMMEYDDLQLQTRLKWPESKQLRAAVIGISDMYYRISLFDILG